MTMQLHIRIRILPYPNPGSYITALTCDVQLANKTESVGRQQRRSTHYPRAGCALAAIKPRPSRGRFFFRENSRARACSPVWLAAAAASSQKRPRDKKKEERKKLQERRKEALIGWREGERKKESRLGPGARAWCISPVFSSLCILSRARASHEVASRARVWRVILRKCAAPQHHGPRERLRKVKLWEQRADLI